MCRCKVAFPHIRKSLRPSQFAAYILLVLLGLGCYAKPAATPPYLAYSLKQHNQGVSAIVFTPDGNFLASGGGSGTKVVGRPGDFRVALWDLANRKRVCDFPGHRDWIVALGFSPNGKQLASSSLDKTIRLWDIDSQTIVATFTDPGKRYPTSAISPNGKLLAIGSYEKMVRIWNLADGSIAKDLDYPDDVRRLAFSPSGDMLAIAGLAIKESTGLFSLRETKSWKEVLSVRLPNLGRLAFSPDGKRIAIEAEDPKTIQILELPTGKRLGRFFLPTYVALVYSMAWHPDGKILALGVPAKPQGLSGPYEVELWDTHSFRPARSPTQSNQNVPNTLAFSPDGKTLATGWGNGTIEMWDFDELLKEE